MKIEVEIKCIGRDIASEVCKDFSRFLNHNLLPEKDSIKLTGPNSKKNGIFRIRVCVEIDEEPYEEFDAD